MPPSVSCSWHGRRRSHHTGCMSIASLAQSAMAGGGGEGKLQGCGMEGERGGLASVGPVSASIVRSVLVSTDAIL